MELTHRNGHVIGSYHQIVRFPNGLSFPMATQTCLPGNDLGCLMLKG